VKSIIVVLAESSGENDGIDCLVAIHIQNVGLYSIYDPATSMNLFLPLVWIYFSKTGSIIGSTSFIIPSIIKVLPSSIQYFKKKSLNFGCSYLAIEWRGSMYSAYLFTIQFYP